MSNIITKLQTSITKLPILKYWKGKEYNFHNNFSNLRKGAPTSALLMVRLVGSFSIKSRNSSQVIINIKLIEYVDTEFLNRNLLETFFFPKDLCKLQNKFSENVWGLQIFSTCDYSHVVTTDSSVSTTSVLCKQSPCGVLWLQLHTGELQTLVLEIFSNCFFL